MSEQHLRKIDLNLLVIMRTLLDTLSVGRTADRLGMSQPAVSRALASLRLLFDDPLLVKSGAKMLPTPRAQQLVEPLQNVVSAVLETLAPPLFEPWSTQRHFRVATTDYGATVIAPGLSKEFFEQAPNAKLEMTPFSRQSFLDLANGDLDIALYSDNEVPETLRARSLYIERFVCVVRTGHPALEKDDGKTLSLEDFLQYPHTLVSVIGGLKGRVDTALATMGLERNIGLWLPYFSTATLAIASSDLILTMPRRAALTYAGMLDIQIVDPPIQIDDYNYRIVWHERSHSEPAHAWLRQLIADTAQETNQS